MLSKLLKYEMKATSRIFLPMYGALLLFSLFNKAVLLIPLDNLYMQILRGVLVLAYVLSVVAVLAITLLLIVHRFYANLLGPEGYLMFTLPVKVWQNVLSKLLVAMLWSVLSTICAALSVILVSADSHFYESFLPGIAESLLSFFRSFNLNSLALTLEAVLMFVVLLSSSVLMLYAAASIGQLAKSHRLLASVGAYLGLSILSQVFVGITFVGIGTTLEVWSLPVRISEGAVPHILIDGVFFYGLIFSVLYYFITHLILSRRLNLD